MLVTVIVGFLIEVFTALFWAGVVVAVLAAVLLTIGLCKMAQIADGKVAADLEIDR